MGLEMTVAGTKKAFRFADGQTVVIGGGVASDILIGSPDIDARHALLAHDGSAWRVYDLRSRSGTKVNGRPIVQERLTDGDHIGIGSFRFDVRVTKSAMAKLAEAPPTPVTLAEALTELPQSAAVVREAVAKENAARIGPFLLEETVHRGSSGKFYRAQWDDKPGRNFCVKIFAKHLARDENAMYRFCRGVTTAGKIKHPNIVRLHRGGKAGTKWFLLMEWMGGGSLRDRIKAAPEHILQPADVVTMGIAICRALEVAAEKRVVHRKITPSSILFDEHGTAKLGDFMLMREVDVEQAQKVTQVGEALGEMTYMSPEQATGSSDIDGRADIYSLAACMFEALSGQPPHVGANIVELLRDIHDRPVVRVSSINRRVPSALDSIIALALAKDVEARYQTPTEFLNDLEKTGIGQ